MKKFLAVLAALALVVSLVPAALAWEPSANVEWFITSSPGGGSDIYTRKIIEIIQNNGWAKVTFLPTNLTDGGGEVGRMRVAMTQGGNAPDHTLLTFNAGDLMPMVANTDNRVENFTPIAVMAVDKQLLFRGQHTKCQTFKEVLDTVKAGTPLTIGGSKGDDIATYNALIAELGLSENQMPYITYDSTGDAITALLGGHVDLLMGKPAAAGQYVEAYDAGDTVNGIKAILALSTERYGGNLADAPTLSELGPWKNVEVPVWRGLVGPGAMSPEAAAFWSDVMKKVAESDQWKTEYLEKNKLVGNFMDKDAAKAYMAQYQKDYLATIE